MHPDDHLGAANLAAMRAHYQAEDLRQLGGASRPLALPGVHFVPAGDADSDNQYTPPDLLEMVLELWGSIDTDPCWSRESFVRAELTYDGSSPEQDGLAQPWRGRAWCNPPYSDPTPWALRCARHATSYHQAEALLLVNVSVSVAWFRSCRPLRETPRAWESWRADCASRQAPVRAARAAFFNRRIGFFKNGKQRKGNDREQMPLYWGHRSKDFARIFGRCAWVP